MTAPASAAPRVLRWVSWGLALLSFVFLGRIVLESSLEMPAYTPRTCALMIAMCVAFAAFPFISAWTWKLSVELVSRRRMRFDEAFGIYLKTNIAKYLPGNVLQYVGRNYLGAQRGWPHRELALGSVVEVISQVVVPCALLLAFYLTHLWTLPKPVAIDADRMTDAALIAAVAAVLLAIAIVVWMRAKGLAFEIRDLLRLEQPRAFAMDVAMLALKVAVLSLAGLVGYTALFYAIASSLLGVEFRGADFINVGCSLTIAGYAGIFTPGVPGGIGVKESISVILVSAYGFDRASVAMVALLARLFSIAGDVIAFLIAMKLGKRPADGIV